MMWCPQPSPDFSPPKSNVQPMRVTITQTQPSVRTTLVGAMCLALQPLALNALSIPVMAYIIHRLGPDGYGQWMTAASLVAVCAILTSLGLRGAFIRAVAADPTVASSALAEQLGLRLLLSVVAAILAVSICWLLGYPAPVLWCTAIGGAGLALMTVATTFTDLLQSFQRMKTVAGVSFATGLILTGSSFAAASFGLGLVAIAAAYLSGPIAGVVLLGVLVHREGCPIRLRCDVRRFVGLLHRSRFFAAQQLLATGSAQAEALLLPRLVGMNLFGFFSAGTLVANRLTTLPDGLCTAAYPAMVRAYTRSARDGARLVGRYLLIAASGGIAVGVLAMLIADPLGRLLLPSDPTLFATIVRITIWSLPLIAIDMVMGYGLNAAGEDAAQARVSAPAAIVSLLSSVGLVLGFGVVGACWSMLLRPAVRAAFLAPLVIRNARSTPKVDASLADEEESGAPTTTVRLEVPAYRKAG
jgi:O-antigen/teichoic acid export membrane protein